MLSANDERRHERRIAAINLVNLEIPSEGGGAEEIVGRTLDLSPTGMRLELAHPLPIGATVSVCFALGDQLVDVEGVVRFANSSPNDMTALGLEFTDMGEAALAAVTRYLGVRH